LLIINKTLYSRPTRPTEPLGRQVGAPHITAKHYNTTTVRLISCISKHLS